MTTVPNEPEDTSFDQLINQWVDTEPVDSELSDSTIKLPESLDGMQLSRAADVQLLHAMLIGLSESSEEAKQHRVSKLMRSIRADKEKIAGERAASAKKPRRYLGPAIRLGTAAMITIGITILLISLPPNKAMATIEQMISAIENAGDRTYSVIVKDQKTGQRERARNRSATERSRQEQAILDGATLYLRGRDKYVLYRYTPSGQAVVNGSDGQTNWLIRPKREVLVSNDPRTFRIPMPEGLADLLTLNFSNTLKGIQERYRIKYLGTVPVEQNQDVSWAYLHATLQERRFRGPRVIRIWAHPDTGLLRRIEFADIRLQGDPELKKLILDLVGRRQLPNDWFSHSAHHPSDTKVDSLLEY